MTDAARARLEYWKQSLLDPSDRLLDIGDDGIPIWIDPVRLAFSLAAGGALSFESDAEPGFDAGRIRVQLPPAELARRLDVLHRAARAATAEREHVLWLALGLLTWLDGTNTTRVAPLVLWPVELKRGTLVAAADRRPRLNDMLLEGLRREHDLVLDVNADLDIAAVMETVTALAATRSGWAVDRMARLATFSFARFDLWRDLDGRDFTTGAVQLLAEPAPLPLAAMTADVVAPLDADASQLSAIAAAGAGGSFVLQGAPGTGKSQTIANLMVHCATQGKSVLVVSDRACALDVIHNRLNAIGLGEMALSLEDDRARVLGALVRVLGRALRPTLGPTVGDSRLAELRTSLDGYADALHHIGPLGMSIHDVIGKLVELRSAPCAALAERDAASLDRATYERRKRAVDALAEAAVPVEPVATHPWRVSALDKWSSDGTERATRALNDLGSAVETLLSAIEDVAKLVPGIVARTPEQLRALGTLADLAAASPRPGAELLTNVRGARNDEVNERIALIRARGAGALDVPRDPSAFMTIATRHRALVDEVDLRFTEAVSDLDASELWQQLKRWTGRMATLRYVALRNARAAVRGAAQPGQLQTDEAMLAGLELVIAERACRTALLGAADSARRWFGDLGGDALSLDLARIEDAVAWGAELRKAFDQVSVTGGEAGRQAAWRALVAQVSASPTDGERPAVELAPFSRLAAAVMRWEPALHELAAATGTSVKLLGPGSDHLIALRDQIEALHHAVGSLGEWTKFHLARRDAIVAGVGPAIAAIERGDIGALEIAGAWQRATLVAWLALELMESPELATWSGSTHHAHAAAFADLDRGSLALTRARAVSKIAERAPRKKDSDPEIAILRAALDEGRPLRAVLADLPTLLPRLTPCVLATPQAVARYLDSATRFDVVVFDEASRLPISHALGALARARTAIVVGDVRQPVPPEGEGLLAVALDARMPQLALATHYRSRHEDLFAFANSRYYDDRLDVLPAPGSSPNLGVSWRRVDGTPDAAGANLDEAKAIAGEVRDRFATSKRSLAIVTMSRAQQALLEDLLADVLASKCDEPLLIGTPDQLQGQERDVVYVSIGDSAEALGALAHPGGERWLDVAITRAREQMIIVSSFAPEDVVTEIGCARQLAELLAFARAGGGAGKPPEDVDAASPITASIARSLAERGWTVRHRIGCGGYKIDLAVVDPSDPDRYVLAIEHDGLTYASSSATARDNRLRAQFLTQLGWRLHRVWSLDWWLDADREVQRVHGAIVAAVAATRRRSAPTIERRMRPRASSAPSFPLPKQPEPNLAAGSGPLQLGEAATAPMRLPRGAILIGPYTAAAVPAGRRAPDDMFAPRYLSELGKCVEQVLAAEAPIHIDLLARRVAAYFGIGRVTQRVLDQIHAALLGRGKWGDEKGFVWRMEQDTTVLPPVRVAGQTGTSRRDIQEVPLCELAGAVRIIVERVNGVTTQELVRDCARLLGFARITNKVTERVALGVRLAATRELIAIDHGKASLVLA